MIDEPRKTDFLQYIPNDMRYKAEPGWWEGFSASVAYNNMPMVESVEEAYRFGDREVDPTFNLMDNVSDDVLPYAKDVARAKDLEHLRFLEDRVRKAVNRRNVMNEASLSSQIAGGIVDPLFLTSFVPMLNAVTLGKTVGGAALKLGAIGAGYGVASEARRAPFAVADEEFESVNNIVAATALSALTGGVLKGAANASPYIMSSARKFTDLVRGRKPVYSIDEKGNHRLSGLDRVDAAIDREKAAKAALGAARKARDDAEVSINDRLDAGEITSEEAKKLKLALPEWEAWRKASDEFRAAEKETAEIVKEEFTETPFNTKMNNPFGGPIQKLLDDETLPQDIKEELVKLSYNSSIGLEGTATQAMPQSVAQRSNVYYGVVKQFEEKMNDLYEGHAFGVKKSRQVFGVYSRDYNPFDKSFDEWFEDTVRRYIMASSPDPEMQLKARTALSDQQKEAFTEIRKFFDAFDEDARLVGRLKDDEAIYAQLRTLGDELTEKREMLASIEANAAAKNGYTKKQSNMKASLEREIEIRQNKADALEEALNTRTRKSFLFPIYYDKAGMLADDSKREGLRRVFEDHYSVSGDINAAESSEKTLMRIMEENAEEMEDFSYKEGTAGMMKHFKGRKTDINEWQVLDYMNLSMAAVTSYATKMGKQIEFARAYGGRNINEVMEDLETNMRKKGMSEKKIAKVKTAFIAEYDRVMGQLIRDPSRLNYQASQFVKTYAGWTFLHGSGIAAVTDVGTIVLSHGMEDVVRAAKAAVGDSHLSSQTAKEMRYTGAAVDMAKNMAVQRILGDSIQSIQPNRLERVSQVGNSVFYTLNGLGPITYCMKLLDQILANDKFIRLARQFKDGDIDDFDREYLFRYGFDEDLINYVNDMPTQQADGSTFLLANTDDWPRETARDRNMLRRYQAAMNAHSENAVVMGQSFDRPLIMDGVAYMKDNGFFRGMRKAFPKMFEIDERASTANIKMVRIENGTMSLPFTFMNFVMGANNKILGAVLDPNRKYRLQGAAALLGFGYLSLELRTLLLGNYSYDKLWDEPWENSPDIMARLIDYSGLLGIYGDLGYMGLSMAANFAGTDGKDWPISPKYVSRDEEDRLLDGIAEPFGAPVGLGLNVARGVNDLFNGNISDARKELAYSLPFVGLPLLGSDMKELLIGTGRY